MTSRPRAMDNDCMVGRLRRLYQLQLEDHPDCPSLYAAYLQAGCELLGTGVGVVAHLDTGACHIDAAHPDEGPLSPGDTLALEKAPWAKAAATGETVITDGLTAECTCLATLVHTRDNSPTILAFCHRGGHPFPREDRELVELLARALDCATGSGLPRRRHRSTIDRLDQSNELFESVFQYAPIGMALIDTTGHILRSNEALTGILGYSDAALFGKHVREFTHPEDIEHNMALLEQTLAGEHGSYRMEKRYLHRDGAVIWGLLSVSLVRDGEGAPQYFIAQIQDITEIKQARLELERQRAALEVANRKLSAYALTDTLTDLPNRRAFEGRLAEAVAASNRNGQPVSLALIDVDDFKHYNDHFGHPAGDEALQVISAVMRDEARSADFLARYGGEEFALILPDTEEDEAVAACERLCASVASVRRLRTPVTVSIGCATHRPGDGDGADNDEVAVEALLHRADIVLYRAKHGGRNRVCREGGGPT
ncbi:sensor domain-containing diguanylate cyclase [Arhodomonas sp. SL1]|uniref:sensor domain-containing diguanylate cyclase n=1 Tax=Arhodomonas sp. SL1 TaxID=3425691 RepID=UPI003F885A97